MYAFLCIYVPSFSTLKKNTFASADKARLSLNQLNEGHLV